MRDPNRWQPLALARSWRRTASRSPGGAVVRRSALGPRAGLRAAGFGRGLPIDPGAPPRLEGDAGRGYKRDALTVISRSAELDPRNGVTLDIGPGARGGNSLGANDGHGHDVNPATGKPYAPNVVLAGRLQPRAGRVLGGRRSSMATNLRSRRSRVSGFLASPRR